MRKIQQREFPTNEEKAKKPKHREDTPVGGEKERQLTRGKHLIAHKLNSKIYTLQKWIRETKCIKYSKRGDAQTQQSEQENQTKQKEIQ